MFLFDDDIFNSSKITLLKSTPFYSTNLFKKITLFFCYLLLCKVYNIYLVLTKKVDLPQPNSPETNNILMLKPCYESDFTTSFEVNYLLLLLFP